MMKIMMKPCTMPTAMRGSVMRVKTKKGDPPQTLPASLSDGLTCIQADVVYWMA